MATTPSAPTQVILTCVLMLLTCIQLTTQQVSFYNTCQDASAVGTLTVSIKESDTQASIDASPTEYRAGLSLAGNTNSIGLQFDANAAAKLPPGEYFDLESGVRSGSLTGREWFLRLKKPINRDGDRPDSLDDNPVFEYTLQCTDLTINTAFFILLRVQILDVNDNSPVFRNAPYAVSVNELTPIGTTVFRDVTATDLDFDFNKNIVFDILPSAGSDKFAIDIPSLGYVTVKNTLDFEVMNAAGNTNYVLSIRARDSAVPPEVQRSSTTTLNITITDGDDQKPIFEYPTCYTDTANKCFNPSYSASIVSGQSLGEVSVFPIPASNPNVAINIQARDQDTLNSPITFTVELTEPRGYENRFQVTSEQIPGTSTYRARLQLVAAIDRSQVRDLRVIIRARESSANARYNRAVVYLTVAQANNNPPSVSTSIGSPIGYIREDALARAFVKDQPLQNPLKLVVTDADIAAGDTPQRYTYEVTPSSPFFVDNDGFLRVTAGNLDYESVQQYTFNVIVREQDTTQQRSGSISLTVNVVDINDNTPFFVGIPYGRSLPEGDYTQGAGEFIAQVQAQDLDSVDTSITYEIQSVSSGGAGKFTISSTNGQLLLRAVVGLGEEYTIIVTATDSTVPKRSASVPVYVTVTSSGNKDPQIPAGLYTVYVSEGIDANRDIFTIPATDPDNQPLTFSIINGNNGNTFSINNNGIVSNRVTLDRETVPEYNLTITAADLGSSPASTVLRVIVTDVNDNSPVFLNSINNRYFFNVQEAQTPPATVGNVAAADLDQSGTPQATVIYDMVGQNSFFRIDGQTGAISTLVPLDFETQKQHEFTVRAIDSGASPRANVATVVVSVIDTQDSIPLFGNVDYEGSIQENLNVTSVLTVSAIDADQTDNIVYQFAGGEFQSFFINPSTGVISTVIPLDNETKNLYALTVTTSDGVNTNILSSTATVTISVIDQNDFTPVLRTTNGVDAITVLENLAISEQLVDIDAADNDPPNTPNSRVMFSIGNVVPTSGRPLFFINPTTGQLVLSNPFTDDPGVPTYTVTVVGTNEGTPQRAGIITITVTVIRNTAPVFNPTTLQANIDENSITQVVPVITATATDTDTASPFNVLTYTLRGDGPAIDYFQVNSASGEIQTRALLSSTTDRSFTLRIRATDGGGLYADLQIDLTVNKNLNAPSLNQQNYTETIFENRALGSAIVTIRATDADRQPPHNQLSYSITGDATAQQFFAVNSRGEIYLIRSPAENPAISAFNMIVDVRDQGLPTNRPANPNPAYVIINVIRNANPPVFFTREYNRVIPENTTIGQSVERVVATDADTQGNFGTLRYSIIGDGTADDIFQINENSGIVSVKTSLTTTPINDFTVRIVAQDGGSPPRSATALLYVTVTRNFARPLWSSATYATSIPETAPVLENILRVTATDSDAQPPSNEVSYELVGDAIQLYYFEIVSSTGDIRPRRPLTLDTSRRSRFDFVVNARDNGSPRLSAAFNATVTISVYRNNNAPRFIQDPYSITVNQGLGSGTVISVRAFDDDPTTEFNQITYSIEGPANALALFTIDGSGNIQPTNPAAINSASQTSYKIFVRVEDNGSPKLYDFALVELTINRNLNPPVFNPVNYEKAILEARPIGDVVFRVTASDADNLAPYNIVQYEINSPLSSPLGRLYFMVDPNTGDVSLRCYLESDTSNTSVYTLVVDAVDGGGRRANRSANVKITVDRKTPLQPTKDNNTMSLRASVCCQEPLPPYWGGSTTTTPTPSTCGPMTDASLGEDCSNARCVAVNSSCVTTSAGSRRCACVNKNVQISATECSMGPSVLSSTTNYVFPTDLSRTSVTVGSIMFDGLSTFPTNAFSIEGQVYPDEGILYIKRNSRHIDVALVKEISNAKTFVVALRATSGEFTVQQVVTVRITSSTFTPEDVTVMLVEGTRKGTLIADVRTISSLGGYSNFEMETTDQTARALFNVTTSGQVLCGQDMILSDFTNNDTVAKEYIFSVKTRGQSATIATFYILLFKGSFLTRLDENWVGDILTYSITSSKFQVDINDTLPDGLNLTKNLTSVRLVNAIDFDAGIKSIDFKLDLVTTDRTKSTTVDVHINIDDLNDEPPELNERVYDFTVLAGSKRDTVVGVVDVTDGDTVGWITFHLEGENKDDFSINDDGVLTSEVDLTRGRFPSAIPLRVKAYDGVTYSDEVNITVYLMSYTINAGNLNKTFHGRVSENSPGAFVANVTVPNYTGYKFRNSRAHRFFSLNSTSGIVTTAIGLDRENDDHAHTEFTILAYMGSDDQCLPLTIGQLITNIMDLNDNTPEFSRPSYTGGVKENSIPGTLVDDLVDIAVTDEDTGVNGSVNFALTGPGKTYFAVEKSNHNKFTIKTSGTPVDREVTPYVVLTLTGTDNPSNPNTGTTTLNITIIDVNDNVPQFNSGTTVFWVEENVQPKTITTLTATDKDEGFSAKISYSLKDGGFGFFKVDESTGEVSTTKAIDRESRKVFNLSIEARDQGSPFQESVLTITVNIRDVNDEKPTFTKNSYKSHYTENSPCDRNILTMTATDQDEGSNATIRFSTTSSYFTVDPTSGAIRCVVPLDYEEMRQHLIEIKAENPGFPTMSDTVTVEINVEDVNDNSPRFNKAKYQSEITTLEWVTDNPVDVFDVTDDDSGKNGQFRFSMNGETDTFYIDGDTVGLLRIKEGASQPVASTTYNFDVTATDKGSPSLNVTVPVSVDVKKIQGTSTVRFSSNDLSFSIQEEKIYTTSFGRANASHDASVSVRYTLIHGGDFHIDPSSGALTCSKALDRETAANHTMVVRVRDIATNASDLAVIKITVEDENDNGPRFLTIPEQHVFSVKEDSAVDTFIARIMAHDKDAGDNGTVTYSIELQTPRTHFYIHPGTGRITVSGDLDREAFEEYSLTIKAADNADVPKTATTQARILILDINDNPPTFQTPNAVTVKEDRSLLTSVATVNATDRDLAQHGVVTYFPDTVMVNGTVCPFKVSVETGVVKVSGDLDYETTSTYECIVTAVDMKRCSSCTGRLTGSTTMSVTILDFNDNPPVFQGAPYRANISRDADINTLVTDVITATDRDGVMDGNGVVKYHILSNINYFKIDRDSGDISVATTLDSVDEDEVTLRIMATDLPQADPAMEAITNVTISIMTDKPRPFFKKEYTFKLTENEKPDEDKRVPIRAYVRKESDEFACNCTYEILVTEYSESFYVDSMTGDLRQKDPIDREETGSHFYVTVKATDRGSGLQRTKQVAIIVADVNDNFPYFSKTQQNFAVLQSAPVGHEIGRVMSVDADELSDPIYTAFTDVEGIELLRNGTLVVRASLLNYTYVRMVVNVKEDHFKGTFNVLASTNAKVYINVRPDYNDHAPTFGKDTYEASLMFLSRKGTEVKINNFRATDADGDSVTYAIQRGNHRDTFTIDSHSGKISVQYTLDDTVPRVLDLVVIATDSSRYRRTGSCAVIISLRDFTATECIAENAYSELQQSAQQRVLFLGLFIAMAALLAVISLIAVFAVYKWRTLPKTKSMVAQEMHPVPTGYDLLGANMTEEERSYYRLRGRDAPPGVPNEAYVSASSRPTSYIHPVEGSPYYDDADADSIELQT